MNAMQCKIDALTVVAHKRMLMAADQMQALRVAIHAGNPEACAGHFYAMAEDFNIEATLIVDISRDLQASALQQQITPGGHVN